MQLSNLHSALWCLTEGILLVVFLTSGCKVGTFPSKKETLFHDKSTQNAKNDLARNSEVAWENLPGVNSVTFVGAEKVWLVTSREGTLLHTNDGGANWSDIPIRPSRRFETIYFLSPQLGWAVAEEGQVLRTTDGGHTWALLTKLKANERDPNFVAASQIIFTDESHGWILETFSIYRTEDGGLTWERGTINSTEPADGDIWHGTFFNAQEGFVNVTSGEVYHTKDGGKTWQVQEVTKDRELSDIFFINKNIGWLCGGNSIYITSDGGKTWKPSTVGSELTLIKSIHFINDRVGWSVGYVKQANDSSPKSGRSIILQTMDGGLNWRPLSVGDKEPFFSYVRFMNTSEGWLIGRDKIYRTEDGGETWHETLQLSSVIGNQG